MLLIVDNYDSFTYNLVDYFEQLGQQCDVVKNDLPPEGILHNKYDGLVLSPGPGKPEDAGYLLDYIAYFEHKLPILGICLGHQAIAQFYEGQVRKAFKPMHGKISIVEKIVDDDIFSKLPQTWQVVRYHSLVVNVLDSTYLTPLAATSLNENMALKHNELPIYGIQYHPEAVLSEYGLEILSNWLMLKSVYQPQPTAIKMK